MENYDNKTLSLSIQIEEPVTISKSSERGKNPVSMTVITGYLGGGKSILVKHVLNAQHEKKIAVILNEFSDEIGVEITMINKRDNEMLIREWVELANGCLCCVVKHSLVQALEQLIQRKDRLDHIMLENPTPLAYVLWLDDQIKSSVELDSIITVVDTKNSMLQLNECYDSSSLLEEIPQISFEDMIILNNVDFLYPEDFEPRDFGALGDLEKKIHDINSLATIARSVWCQVDLSKILDRRAYNTAHLDHLESLLKESQSISSRSLHNSSVRSFVHL